MPRERAWGIRSTKYYTTSKRAGGMQSIEKRGRGNRRGNRNRNRRRNLARLPKLNQRPRQPGAEGQKHDGVCTFAEIRCCFWQGSFQRVLSACQEVRLFIPLRMHLGVAVTVGLQSPLKYLRIVDSPHSSAAPLHLLVANRV